MKVIGEVWRDDCYRTSDVASRGPGEIVVDVGAHIGSFARKWYQKNPRAQIYCVEACRDNMPVLRMNVGAIAVCFLGAVTYEPGDVTLLNSIDASNGTATGGSRVVPVDADGQPATKETFGHTAWHDTRPVAKYTLEHFVGRTDRRTNQKIEAIDVLKLDCEGSEFSILENSPSIETSVKLIVGEYHDADRWERLRLEKYSHWDYKLLSVHETKPLGIFHLKNPRFK